MADKINRIKFISHEIKNQLSICDLYAEIIKKICIKNEIFDMNIIKSLESIKTSIKMSNNSLLELKSCDTTVIEKHSIALVLEEAIRLSEVYGLQKEIQIQTEIKTSTHVLIDKTKFIAVIINLVKNACEAFEDEPDKKILIKTYYENGFVKVNVSNNAKPIEYPEKIFSEEFSTKQSGNGLGLLICKEYLESMDTTIKLIKTDNISTEFEIMLKAD